MTVGIDIGGKQHAVARCREGQDQAEREVLRISQDRAGFDRLDAWLDTAGRAGRSRGHGVLGSLLDGPREPPAGAGVPVPARGQPAGREVLCEEPPGSHQVRPGRCEEPRADGHA